MRRRNDDGDVAEGMTVDEIIQLVRTAILNNQLTLEELTKALQMENKLRNSDDEKRAKLIELNKQEMKLPEDAALDEGKKAIESVTYKTKAYRRHGTGSQAMFVMLGCENYI